MPADALPMPAEPLVEKQPGGGLVLKGLLLLVWFVVSFGGTWFARDLSRLADSPNLHYWLGAQGALLVFIAIVAVYAIVMNRWESLNHRHQGAASPEPDRDA